MIEELSNYAASEPQYDIATDDIQCFADRVGARVYEFRRGGQFLRVLAHDKAIAKLKAQREFLRRAKLL